MYRAPGHRVTPTFAVRLWLAFASLVGVFIASLIVAPVASIVMIGIFAIVSSGLGSGEPLLPADRVPLALQGLTEGFAAFATAALLLGTSAAIHIARRVVPTEDDSSTAAIVFTTVLVADVAAGAGFLGPYWFRSHLTPTTVVILLGAAALAGTIPLRTKGRVSPWLYACLGLVVAAPLGVAGAWRLHRASVPRVVQSSAPLSGAVEVREFARSTRTALTIVAIAHDGTVYYSDGARLTARGASGSEAWFHEWEDPKPQFARGMIAADGTLYVAAGFRVYAFGARGETRWIYDDDGSRTEPQILALGSDGTVYVGVAAGIRPSLHAVSANGAERWRVNVKATAISVGHDGVVFVAGDKVLSAYTADGRLDWTRKLDFAGQPAIGDDGTLYLAGSRTLTALRPDGTLRWTADTATERQEDGRTPVIGGRGVVYVANSNLWAVDPDGAIKWRWAPPVSDPAYTLHHAPLVALDGTIVVAAVNGTVYGITPEGTLRWMHEQGSQIHSLALGPSGAIYIVVNGAIVTIHPRSGASAGPALWPQERHDAQNTSHAPPQQIFEMW